MNHNPKETEAKIKDIRLDVTDDAALKNWQENNQDPYGSACVSYAIRWGRLMQYEMQKGKTLVDCAKETSHEADVEGITGFMYGAAVNVLVSCWKHGEELRKWHNGEYGHEGDGVVNPAILTINTK